jgi:hypothetical protein
MLLLQLIIFGFSFLLIGLFMLYKKKYVLAIGFILMGIMLMVVGFVAMYLYPQKSVF